MEETRKEAVENYLRKNCLTKTEFCKRCKINIVTLNKILNDQKVSIVSILKIVKATELQLEDFFEPTNEEGKE